jgi:SepF-like predicted cell division protein (DUF552 family)
MSNLIARIMPSGGSDNRSVDDYHELDIEQPGSEVKGPGPHVQVATIKNNQHVLDVRDAVYDGNIVIATIKCSRSNITEERVTEMLAHAANDVGGDIVQKGANEFLLTPSGSKVARERIGGN